jgi:hypothetical protein
LLRLAVPVSVTVKAIVVDVPSATLDGVAVADDANVSEEFTTILAAELLRYHLLPCRAEDAYLDDERSRGCGSKRQ